MTTESLRAKGLTTTVTHLWAIDDMSLFITDDFSCRIKQGQVGIEECELAGTTIFWNWFDEDGDVIQTINRRLWLVWLQEHLAPAIEVNRLSVAVMNELQRMSGGVTTEQAKANGSPF